MPDVRAAARWLVAPPESLDQRAGSRGWVLALIRVASGVIFVTFGAGKFVNHASETDSFRDYGLPSPEAFVIVIGVLELVGGGLLVVGLLTRLTAFALVGDMVGAIIASGLLKGETISLTLAPALLLGMLVLLAWGPGRLALDARLGRGPPRAGGPPADA